MLPCGLFWSRMACSREDFETLTQQSRSRNWDIAIMEPSKEVVDSSSTESSCMCTEIAVRSVHRNLVEKKRCATSSWAKWRRSAHSIHSKSSPSSPRPNTKTTESSCTVPAEFPTEIAVWYPPERTYQVRTRPRWLTHASPTRTRKSQNFNRKHTNFSLRRLCTTI